MHNLSSNMLSKFSTLYAESSFQDPCGATKPSTVYNAAPDDNLDFKANEMFLFV